MAHVGTSYTFSPSNIPSFGYFSPPDPLQPVRYATSLPPYLSQPFTNHPFSYPPASTSEPLAFSVALGEVSNDSRQVQPLIDTVNTSARVRAPPKRSADAASGSRKRQKSNHPVPVENVNATSPATSTPSHRPNNGLVYGVGPASAPLSPPVVPQFGSLVLQPQQEKQTDASDVWYFFTGTTDENRPDTPPPTPIPLRQRPNRKKFEFVRCVLCPVKEWKTYKNVDGQTRTLRKHLQTHGATWTESVKNLQLKGWQTVNVSSGTSATTGPSSGPSVEREPFSLDGFYKRLIRWITVDDQSINSVDRPEFRELLEYLAGDKITDADIPHRTKLADLIVEQFQIAYRNLLQEIELSVGRVSFTADVWSRITLEAYMGVTAHWIAQRADGSLYLRSALIAFRRITGSHSGAHLAEELVKIIGEAQCLHKIGMITLDNASNNGTMMDEMARHLIRLDIPFDVEGNRIRCFPHVINLAVKEGLRHLLIFSRADAIRDHANMTWEPQLSQELIDDPEYLEALKNDVVKRARQLVVACRSSDQRRTEFAATIKKGNEAGGWKVKPTDDPQLLRIVALLRDVETRWSSTYYMVDRLMELMLAVEKFCMDNNLDSYLLTAQEKIVLSDIRLFLYYPHQVQEIVSAEKTPTLPVVLPLYEELYKIFFKLKGRIPKLAHAIDASILKLKEYLDKSRRTKIYGIAMAIHPMYKFQYMRDNWTESELSDAKHSVRTAMLAFQRARRLSSRSTNIPTPATVHRRTVSLPNVSRAAAAQLSGINRLNGLLRSLSEPSIEDTINTQQTEEQLDAVDAAIVDKELADWEAAGLIPQNAPNFDLMLYWASPESKRLFPLLWHVSMDVLPAQASAVPCERVFSSSKETDSTRRSNLSPEMMEMLQILKYIYSRELEFMDDLLLRTEDIIEVVDLEPSVIETLISEGRLAELSALLGPARPADSEPSAPTSETTSTSSETAPTLFNSD